MTSTIDSAGRIVIPRDVREAAGLEPGVPLEIRVRDGRVEIEPMPRAVRVVRRGRLSVAVPVEESGERLTNEQVRRTTDAVRRRGE